MDAIKDKLLKSKIKVDNNSDDQTFK